MFGSQARRPVVPVKVSLFDLRADSSYSYCFLGYFRSNWSFQFAIDATEHENGGTSAVERSSVVIGATSPSSNLNRQPECTTDCCTALSVARVTIY